MNPDDVRALLDRVADESADVPIDPEPLLRRGYRRIGENHGRRSVGFASAPALLVAGYARVRTTEAPTVPLGPTNKGCRAGHERPRARPGSGRMSEPQRRLVPRPLEAGTYTTVRFEPVLTYSVPRGWNNPWDHTDAFDLWTPGWRRGFDDPIDAGVDAGTYLFDRPGLLVTSDPRAVDGCSNLVDETAGRSAVELGEWIAAHPGVETAGPSQVSVGGLAGYRLDLSLGHDWDETCPGNDGLVVVPLLDALRLVGLTHYSSARLYLLDLPAGGSVAILVDGAVLDEAIPVVNSFVFDVG